MKRDFVLEVFAQNNFSVLNRMVNIFNRRRIRIKSILATELEDDYHRGKATFLVHTSDDMLEKARLQLEKLIEVEQAVLLED
ncbi:MAG TPA: ACT domain-containing protein [Sphingobacteriaceae bacterium]|mgnify:FL=1